MPTNTPISSVVPQQSVRQLTKKKMKIMERVVCSGCSKSFKTNSGLNRHVVKKHQEVVKFSSETKQTSAEIQIQIVVKSQTRSIRATSSAVTEFNALSKKNSFKPALPLMEMKLETPYNIKGARRIDTCYGRRVLLELEDNVLFLPDKFNKITDRSIKNLNKGDACSIIRLPIGEYNYELKLQPNNN